MNVCVLVVLEVTHPDRRTWVPISMPRGPHVNDKRPDVAHAVDMGTHEESADTDNDHIHRGQDQSEKDPKRPQHAHPEGE